MDFACAEATATSVRHVLTATDQTRKNYPYDFRLTVVHRVGPGNQLQVEWTVENLGRGDMFFSIGGHPGFLMPADVRKEDCSLLFPGCDALRYVGTSAEGFVLPEEKALLLTDGRAPYQPDVPETWIFEDHQVRSVGIAAPDGRPFVMLYCEQFPMLAVWANPAGPFICLEPWFGRTDDAGFTGSIDRKKGMQRLEEGGRREISYRMEFR